MKKILSLCLSLILILSCVVSASAVGLDTNTNGYSFDALPYLENTLIDTSSLAIGSSIDINLSFPSVIETRYVSGVIQTTDTNPILFSNYWAGGNFTITYLGNYLYSFYGSIASNIPISYKKGSDSSYILFLSLDIVPVNYISNDLDIKVNFQGSYTYRQYNNPSSVPAFNTINDSFNIIDDVTIGANVYTPTLNPNIINSSVSSDLVYNEQSVYLTTFLYFDWTKYDRIDLIVYNDFDTLQDCIFFVDGVNVVRNVFPTVINEDQAVMISLDFTDLDPNINSKYCYLRFRGNRVMNSSSGVRLFQVTKVSCFLRSISKNFWPSWLTKIIDKLDSIFTGTEQDQAGADSFNESISDQANELQDLTADLNSVTRPALSDVDISTDGLVDSSVVLLATNGLGSVLGNDIIIRVLTLALTFALAGFILYGKR